MRAACHGAVNTILTLVRGKFPGELSKVDSLYADVELVVENIRREALDGVRNESSVLRTSAQLLQNTQAELQEAQEDLAVMSDRLAACESQLLTASDERDRARRALEEAHACVTEYHRKLGAMERTVGYSLVSRAEKKELMQRLEAAETLNEQYKSTLESAEARLAILQESDLSKCNQLQDLKEALARQDSVIMELQALNDGNREEEHAFQTQHASLRARISELQSDIITLTDANQELERQHHETLAALSDLVTIQKNVDVEKATLTRHVEDLKELTAQQQSTIDRLRDQVMEEQHQRLRALAEGSYQGAAFDSAQHSTAIRTIRDALEQLEVALPTIAAAVQSAADGSPRLDAASRASAPPCDVHALREDMRRLRQILWASSKFTEEDDHEHTLYRALRDVMAGLEATLSSLLPSIASISLRAQQQLQSAQARVARCLESSSAAQAELAKSKAHCDKLQATIATLQDQLDEETARAQEHLHQLQESRRQAAAGSEDALAGRESRITQLEAQLATERAQRQRMESAKLQQVAALEAEMQTRADALRAAFQRQIDALHEQVVRLERSQASPPTGAPGSNPFLKPRRSSDETPPPPRAPHGQDAWGASAEHRTGAWWGESPHRDVRAAFAQPSDATSTPARSSTPHPLEKLVTHLQRDVQALSTNNRMLEAQMERVLRSAPVSERGLSPPHRSADFAVDPLSESFSRRTRHFSQTPVLQTAVQRQQAQQGSTRPTSPAQTSAGPPQQRLPPASSDPAAQDTSGRHAAGGDGRAVLASVKVPSQAGEVGTSPAWVMERDEDFSELEDAALEFLGGPQATQGRASTQREVQQERQAHSHSMHSAPEPVAQASSWRVPQLDARGLSQEGRERSAGPPARPAAQGGPVPPEVLATARHFEGAEGGSRPATARPASGSWSRLGQPASEDVVNRASEYAGEEGHGRPKTAGPSDHWHISSATPSALKLPPRSDILPAGERVPVKVQTGARTKRVASRSAGSRSAAELAAEQTEGAVLRALEKSGLLAKARKTVKARTKAKVANIRAAHSKPGAPRSSTTIAPRVADRSLALGSHGPGPVSGGKSGSALKVVDPLGNIAASDWPAILRSEAFDRRLCSPRRSRSPLL